MTGVRGITDAPSRDWMRHAACLSADTDIFYPSNGAAWKALKYCESCPVVSDCLKYALRFERSDGLNVYGVYGGMTPAQRSSAIRRANRHATV